MSALNTINYLIETFKRKCMENMQPIEINYKSLALPMIPTLECNLIYNQCIHTNEEYIYISYCANNGLKLYRYNITNNIWNDVYTFHGINCSFISNAINETNNKFYIIGKRGGKWQTPLDTLLCSFDINTMKYNIETIYKQYNVTNFDDIINILTYIPSPINQLHLLYNSSMHHMRINIDRNNTISYREYNGINVNKYNNEARLRQHIGHHTKTVEINIIIHRRSLDEYKELSLSGFLLNGSYYILTLLFCAFVAIMSETNLLQIPFFLSPKILININYSSYQIADSYLHLTKSGTTLIPSFS
eukprot:159276_1